MSHEEPAWLEMPEGTVVAATVVAATVFELSFVREHGQGGCAEVVDLDREVVVVEGDTPPQTDVFERAGVDRGGGDAALEEAPRMAPQGRPRRR